MMLTCSYINRLDLDDNVRAVLNLMLIRKWWKGMTLAVKDEKWWGP